MSVRKMVTTALFAAVLCVLAPLTIPLEPVPLSLATFAVYLMGAVLDWRQAAAAVCVYILLGAVGAPVFSNFTGGAHKLLGVTGGFIFGYLPCAVITAVLSRRFGARRWRYPLAMLCGTAALYLCGTAWFIAAAKSALKAALMACVVPFLPGDAVKIILACALAPALKKRLEENASKEKTGR